MKFLISTPRDDKYCFVGYDWEKNKVFWSLAREKFRNLTLGICYHGNDLVAASFNHLTRFSSETKITTRLREDFETRLHSVHPLDDDNVGVANPAYDRIEMVNREGKAVWKYKVRIGGLDRRTRYDIYHLNDFAVTDSGMYATLFGYHPWRILRKQIGLGEWRKFPFGMIVNMSEHNRPVAIGLTAPHSINAVNDKIFVCSSHSGELVCYERDPFLLKELWRKKLVGDERFLRGAYFISENEYFIGGCKDDHGSGDNSAKIFYIKNDVVEEKTIDDFYGIYDILPWRDDILNPIIDKHF